MLTLYLKGGIKVVRFDLDTSIPQLAEGRGHNARQHSVQDVRTYKYYYIGVKCYGSTSISKIESGGSTPSTLAINTLIHGDNL